MGQNFDEHQVPVNNEVCKMILQHSVRRYCPNVDTVGPTKEPTLPFSFYLRQQWKQGDFLPYRQAKEAKNTRRMKTEARFSLNLRRNLPKM